MMMVQWEMKYVKRRRRRMEADNRRRIEGRQARDKRKGASLAISDAMQDDGPSRCRKFNFPKLAVGCSVPGYVHRWVH